MKRTKFIALVAVAGLMIACNKKKDGEVITDTYTGNVVKTSGGADPGGDFTGNGDNGTYAFGWQNNSSKAEANFDITTPTGSLNFILKDDKDVEVLNVTRSAGGNDTYSGVSDAGEPGIWTVMLTFTDFNGDGSYSLSPVD